MIDRSNVSMEMKEFKVTRRISTAWKNMYGEAVKCGRCGKELKIGEVVLSRRRHGGAKKPRTKHWHKKCYGEMLC